MTRISYIVEFTEWGESAGCQHVAGLYREVPVWDANGWILRLEHGTLSGRLLEWAKGRQWKEDDGLARIILTHPQHEIIVATDIGYVTPLMHSGLHGSKVDELFLLADGVGPEFL